MSFLLSTGLFIRMFKNVMLILKQSLVMKKKYNTHQQIFFFILQSCRSFGTFSLDNKYIFQINSGRYPRKFFVYQKFSCLMNFVEYRRQQTPSNYDWGHSFYSCTWKSNQITMTRIFNGNFLQTMIFELLQYIQKMVYLY